MRKLVFFIGPAAAGKTTLAKALAQRFRAVFLDMDTLIRPSAEVIMTLCGQDPTDRDSPVYKKHCRDLGYRVTMEAALENIELGLDVFVVGPFTKETEDPDWIERELAQIGASITDVEVRVVYVYLQDLEQYRQRLEGRGSVLDQWKLEHWDEFSRTLVHREIRWKLPEGSVLYVDNTGPASGEKLAQVENFIFGGGSALSDER
ncbi:AAA family ATPase [Paenibacillus turpanensis]|uniref:AAA family ATPase n=1 Tax=Paenibacillus turpanensis TaxID=2689078 RepID=UPI00140C0FE5|nr:AAA family ATPase [Paenibacillus turpanensis]